jgi:hypothetical protein
MILAREAASSLHPIEQRGGHDAPPRCRFMSGGNSRKETPMLLNYYRSTATFDSHLYLGNVDFTTNADFYLILRVCLQQGEVGAGKAHDYGYSPGAADAAAHTFDSLAWGANEWENLKKKFKADAEKFWSGKFWLAPKARYTELLYPEPPKAPHVQCNIYCRLQIDMLGSPADAHKIITIYKVPPGRFFRADSDTYTADKISEVNPQVDQHGHKLKQRTLFHEVGHALGLNHVGVSTHVSYAPGKVCVEADQADVQCYTGPKDSDTASIMGRGNTMTLREAKPWQDRIATHTSIAGGDWRTTMYRVYPSKI